MALYQHVKALMPYLRFGMAAPITVHSYSLEEVGPWVVFVYIAIEEL